MEHTNAWQRLKQHLIIPKEQPKAVYLSNNSKTGLSINVPPPLTCRPTKACIGFCYAATGPVSFPLSIVRQAQNWLRFEYLARASADEVADEADRIAGKMRFEGQDWLRVFGVGDLQHGSLRLINALARRHPELTLWVSTRRWDLAKKLSRKPNLQVMLSIDSTTQNRDLQKAKQMLKERPGQALLAFVQCEEGEKSPLKADVVFPVHRGSKRAAWTRPFPGSRRERAWCPAVLDDGEPHKNACDKCRRCFDPKKRR